MAKSLRRRATAINCVGVLGGRSREDCCKPHPTLPPLFAHSHAASSSTPLEPCLSLQAAELPLSRKRPLQVGGEVLEKAEPNGLKGMVCPVAGIMCALVPGLPDATLTALREYGTKSFAEVVAPAIEFADGAAIDEMRSGSIQASLEFFTLWPTSMRHFAPNGHAALPGEIFRQPDLARTLRSLVAAEQKALSSGASRVAAIDAVRDEFYRGEIAKKIDEFSKANNGLLRYEDMASFHLTPEDALSADFHGMHVYKPGFWSQGPAMIEALNILSGYDLVAMKQNSADYINTMVEALKLAYADRDTYYGDPKFVKVPAETLLSMQYAEERREADQETGLAAGVPARQDRWQSRFASLRKRILCELRRLTTY